MNPTPRMNREQRRERRREIANAVRDGMSTAEACTTFGVSRGTVRGACRENGVKLSRVSVRKAGENVGALRIVAELQRGKSHRTISDELLVSRQYVHSVEQRAIDAGVSFAQPAHDAVDAA